MAAFRKHFGLRGVLSRCLLRALLLLPLSKKAHLLSVAIPASFLLPFIYYNSSIILISTYYITGLSMFSIHVYIVFDRTYSSSPSLVPLLLWTPLLTSLFSTSQLLCDPVGLNKVGLNKTGA